MAKHGNPSTHLTGAGQKDYWEAIRYAKAKRKNQWKDWKSPFASEADVERQKADIYRKGLATKTSGALSGNANNKPGLS